MKLSGEYRALKNLKWGEVEINKISIKEIKNMYTKLTEIQNISDSLKIGQMASSSITGIRGELKTILEYNEKYNIRLRLTDHSNPEYDAVFPDGRKVSIKSSNSNNPGTACEYPKIKEDSVLNSIDRVIQVDFTENTDNKIIYDVSVKEHVIYKQNNNRKNTSRKKDTDFFSKKTLKKANEKISHNLDHDNFN